MATTRDQSDSVVGGVIGRGGLLGGQQLHPSEPRTYHLEPGHVENARSDVLLPGGQSWYCTEELTHKPPSQEVNQEVPGASSSDHISRTLTLRFELWVIMEPLPPVFQLCDVIRAES